MVPSDTAPATAFLSVLVLNVFITFFHFDRSNFPLVRNVFADCPVMLRTSRCLLVLAALI
jgi:hypothetical protein